MLAGGAAWQPACLVYPCLQLQRLRKLGKGFSMKTAICVPGAAPRRVQGLFFPLLLRTVSFPNADFTHG